MKENEEYEVNGNYNINNDDLDLKIGNNSEPENVHYAFGGPDNNNNINNNNCYAYLFTGNTGVGKTMTAINLAKILNYHLLRIDMSEYHDSYTISKLIGTSSYNNSSVLDSINTYPFTILVLDEIDKCHESILNLFLSAIDNNVIKNGKGDNIYFNNTIIIMTTNISGGTKVGFNGSNAKVKYDDYFSKDLLNRISNIIEFNSLNEEDIIKIINLNTKKMKLRIKNKNKIINKCEYKKYGARQIPYIIKDYQNRVLKV